MTSKLSNEHKKLLTKAGGATQTRGLTFLDGCWIDLGHKIPVGREQRGKRPTARYVYVRYELRSSAVEIDLNRTFSPDKYDKGQIERLANG